MAAMTKDEVAKASGVDVATVEQMAAASIISPEGEGSFRPTDVARIRLVKGLREAGFSLQDLGEALSSGRLSLDFVDYLMPEPVRLVPPPGRTDLHEEWETQIGPILGTHRGPGDPIREDDLALLDLFGRAVSLGIPPEHVIGIVRTTAQAVSRLVDLQREFVDKVLLGPAIAETGSPITALEATSATRYEYRKLGRELITLLLDRFVDDAIFTNLVHLTEIALEESGLGGSPAEEAVVFIDISSFTRLSEQHGSEVAALQATLLAGYMQELARAHGSRLVKSLGDGAMLHSPDGPTGLLLALEAVDGAERRGLWPVHASVNVGAMVKRDGDLFGTAVNVASRLASQAEQGEVVVTGAVAEQWGEDDSVVFERVGEVDLRNVGEPVTLYLARTP